MVFGLIAFLSIVIPLFLTIGNGKKENPPRKISYVIVGLLVVHWLFFLASGYALLPPNIANAVFTPLWLALSIAGALTAIYEFKNNKVIAIPVAGLTIISLMLSVFSYGISKM